MLPTDPGYTPFGWRPLRGLNATHVLVVVLVCLTWRIGGMLSLSERVPMAEILPHMPLWTGLSVLAFMPALVGVTLALNSRSDGPWRVGGVVAAVLLTALLHAAMVPATYCWVGLADRARLWCGAFHWHWDLLSTFARATLWGGLFAALMYFERQALERARSLHRTERQRLDAERQEGEARLRSLQAQVEPHFLFNTLAHIQHLHLADPGLGRSMLRSLIDYMRSALPQMRQTSSTLGRELALTQAYLQVQQVRMGGRLHVETDVPAELLDAALPPMMLLTLAENAVKHGIGPRREGGTLRLEAHLLRDRGGDRLEVVVRDDGVGLQLGAGSGRGLANTRARLASLYGGKARLAIDNQPDGGVRAALNLPLRLPTAPAR